MARSGGMFTRKRWLSIGWHCARAAFAVLGLLLCLVASVDLFRPGAIAAQADFPEPTDIRAVDGVLRTTLIAEEQEIALARQRIKARVFNGAFVGPTLRA